jgi:hypothetical protein
MSMFDAVRPSTYSRLFLAPYAVPRRADCQPVRPDLTKWQVAAGCRAGRTRWW